MSVCTRIYPSGHPDTIIQSFVYYCLLFCVTGVRFNLLYSITFKVAYSFYTDFYETKPENMYYCIVSSYKHL